ncbi:hypothetical protein PG985_003841 [Apiospora marii]|uniref:uncharacterized protein n=1 Tax=Apiospora marii TaxID=335849 RepID=UPI0031311D5D
MKQCKALIDANSCLEFMDWYESDWCTKHTLQHRVSHDFYKDVEAEWDHVRWSSREDAQSKQDELCLLSVAIAAREAHTDWFYQSQPDPGHKSRERELRSKRETVKLEVYAMEHAIVTKMSKPLIQETIRPHIKQVSASDFPNRPGGADASLLEEEIMYQDERQ